MRKLQLDPDTLDVQSFEMVPDSEREGGTVRGAEITADCEVVPVPFTSIQLTCGTCFNTCKATCDDRTCGYQSCFQTGCSTCLLTCNPTCTWGCG